MTQQKCIIFLKREKKIYLTKFLYRIGEFDDRALSLPPLKKIYYKAQKSSTVGMKTPHPELSRLGCFLARSESLSERKLDL